MRINGQQRLRYQRNIVKLYNDVTIDSIISGKRWYETANLICRQFADCYEVHLKVVCQIMAILSPASSWDNNIVSTEKVLKAFTSGKGLDSFTVATYGANKVKAWKVICGLDTFRPTDTNLKIWAFYNNILNPNGVDHVTIDRHAMKVLNGDTKAGSVAITPRQYRIAEYVYKITAEKFDLKPHELQAILWVTYKQKVGR